MPERGLRTRLTHVHAIAGEATEQRRGHLRATGVLHADEEHLGHRLRDRALRLREGGEAVTGETGRETRKVGLHLRGARERGVGLEHDALHGLLVEHAVELAGQVLGGPVQHRVGDSSSGCCD